MKKTIGFLLFAFALILNVNAQEAKQCSKKNKKSCAKTCAKKASTASVEAKETVDFTAFQEAADAAAEADDSIVRKVCAHSGKVSYAKQVTNDAGETVMTPVKFCSESNQFKAYNSDADGGAVKKSCSSAQKKSCSKKCAKSCAKKSTSSTIMEGKTSLELN